ncbi:MAG: conjugal transfer protein TraN [Nitrococcus sp.]|nr:conjugal transfer protein TraN [Nitrococcus sp.]
MHGLCGRWWRRGWNSAARKRRSYCTFSSPLSRSLEEQIRAAVRDRRASPEHPNCRGLTIAEINQANWEQVNLDEWLAILQTTGQMPTSTMDAMNRYSMTELTENVPMLNADGTREDTLTRNRQRLSPHSTLHRNEGRRQELWGN